MRGEGGRMKEGRKEEGKSVGKGAAAFGGGTKGGFSTIDTSFCLTKSQLENPSETDATQMYNGQPTSFTDLQSNSLNLDPKKAATLKRSNFLPYDGVLYEINDANIEQEALWSYGNKTHLTYNEYLREIRDQRRMQLQHIVVKGQTGKTFDYSKSPHRPLSEFFNSLVVRRAPRLRLLIPVTLVVSEGSRSLLFTDTEGFVQKISGDKCDDQTIQEMFKVGKQPRNKVVVEEPNGAGKKVQRPVAVMKRSSSGQNEVTMLNDVELIKMMRDSSLGNAVIQQFIKPRGSHPAMYRSTWRRNIASSTIIVSGHRPMEESNLWHTSSTLIDTNTVLSFRGIGATQTQRLASGIVLHLETYGTPCTFHELTCDFIKGEDGAWYFLQAKCFVCTSNKS